MRVRQTTANTFPLSQITLGRSVFLDGIGVHSGAPARLTLHPADADSGIVFHRTNLPGERECFIPAVLAHAVPSELATRLAPPQGASVDGVGTVEHVLATLAALGIDNALVEIDGGEVPILDGSAQPIVDAVDEAGIVRQRRGRRVLEVVAPVRVALRDAVAEFTPFAGGLALDITIDFAASAIGRQRRALVLDAANFRAEIARARTFGSIADAERLWRDGLAQGSSFENTIVVDEDRVLNPGSLRFPDECVRHKMLDAIGDLALAGMPIRGVFRSVRGGHALNRAALAALLADARAWRVVDEHAVSSPACTTMAHTVAV